MKNQSYEKAVSVKNARTFSVVFIAQAAMIAALYVVLTFIANTFGLANYAIQVRISEALTILPYFTPAAIPGLVLFRGRQYGHTYIHSWQQSAR